MRISDWSSDVCSSDLAAPLDIGFLAQPLDHPVVQPFHQRVEFASEARHRSAFVLLPGEREGEAENLFALLAAEIVEELDEAGDQVGLGEHDVDREPDATLDD